MALIDYTLTIIAATIGTIISVARWPNWKDKASVLLWLFVVFFSLGLWLRIETIYWTVDQFLGLNNIAWLLGRLLLTSSVYIIVLSLTTSFSVGLPRWTLLSLLLVLGFHILLYADYTRSSRSLYSDQLLLDELSIMLSRSAMLFEAAILAVFLVKMFLKMQREETSPLTKCRWLVFLVASTSACVMFFVKGLFNVLGYADFLSGETLQVMNGVILTAQAFTLLFLLGFLPQRFFNKIVQPINIMLKIYMLRDLQYLRQCLEQLTDDQPNSVTNHLGFFNWFWEVDLALHKTFIKILDKEHFLLRQQEANNVVTFFQHQLLSRKASIAHVDVIDAYFQDISSYSRLGKLLRELQFQRTLASLGTTDER